MDIAKLFNEQHLLINYFFDNLDFCQIEQFSNKLLNCQGLIFLTGMGKSGTIAQNVCQMLVSTGIRAMFLDPVNALHGDVGVIKRGDLVILFSRSGQTTELLNLIPAIRNKGAYIIGVVSDENGLLSKECDFYVYLPLQKELCPFNMAPVTSTIIQLIFGNTIVASIMKKMGISKEEYALNHPAGRIGKRLTVRVEDVMKNYNELPICFMNDTLISQIDKMSSQRCGCLLILNNSNKLMGIFTDGDLRRALQKHGQKCLTMALNEIMTKNPATIKNYDMAYKAMVEMEKGGDSFDLNVIDNYKAVNKGNKIENKIENKIDNKKRFKELPVVNESGNLVGLITLHDLVQFGM